MVQSLSVRIFCVPTTAILSLLFQFANLSFASVCFNFNSLCLSSVHMFTRMHILWLKIFCVQFQYMGHVPKAIQCWGKNSCFVRVKIDKVFFTIFLRR